MTEGHTGSKLKYVICMYTRAFSFFKLKLTYFPFTTNQSRTCFASLNYEIEFITNIGSFIYCKHKICQGIFTTPSTCKGSRKKIKLFF